jgi:hypothetical protein
LTTPSGGDPVCFVYVIGTPNGPQKIGIASDVARRRTALQTASPDWLDIAFAYETTRPLAQEIEYNAHWLLRRLRLQGEWFNVPPSAAARVIRMTARMLARGEVPMTIGAVAAEDYRRVSGKTAAQNQREEREMRQAQRSARPLGAGARERA